MACDDYGDKLSGTESASGQNGQFVGPEKAVDGSTGSYFVCDQATGWIQFELDESAAVERVRFYAGGYGEYAAEYFEIQASNTGAFSGEEVTLFDCDSCFAQADYVWNNCDFDNSTEYKYYRMVCQGIFSGSNWFLYEIEFYQCLDGIVSAEETQGFSDAVAEEKIDRTPEVEETIDFSDSVEAESFAETVTDETGFSDSVEAYSYAETVSDDIGFDDSVEAVDLTADLADDIGFSDTATRAREFVADVTDTLGVADYTIAQDFVGRVTDEIGQDDAVEILREVFADPADTAGHSDSVDAVNWSDFARQYGDRAIRRYYCTLTGAADGYSDLTLPISSFQCRRRSGEASYLSVVIPGIDYAGDIADRPNGEIVIEMGFEIDGEVILREEIVRVDFDNANDSRGPRNRSITLSGYKTQTIVGQATALENPTYRNESESVLRYRFAVPDPYLRPGDTVTVDDDNFTVDSITYTIGTGQQTMEIAEAA